MARSKSMRDCDWCGREYQYRPNVFAKGMGRFCSKSCSNHTRITDERSRFDSYAHGVGVEPNHVSGIGPCVEWTGTRDKDGYGVFSLSGQPKQVRADRYAWNLAHATALLRTEILRHGCDNPPCIRISHLQVGTKPENTQDMVDRDRQAKGERMANSVLTNDRVRVVRVDYATGKYSQQVLADREGVSQHTISRVVRRANWSHVS